MPETKTKTLSPEQIADRVEELKQIDADRKHYLDEHIKIGQDLGKEIKKSGRVLDNEGVSRVCTLGHTISLVFKGKSIVPTVVDSLRPIAYRKPSN